jgi:hypothetical protein
MDSDALESARSRYEAAYSAYLERAKHVRQKLLGRMTPSAEEIEAERQAREHLAVARRELIDAINASLRR